MGVELHAAEHEGVCVFVFVCVCVLYTMKKPLIILYAAI